MSFVSLLLLLSHSPHPCLPETVRNEVLDLTKFVKESETRWDDPGLISHVINCPDFQITSATKVQRLEYIDSLPSAFPYLDGVGFVIDLRAEKYAIRDDLGQRMTPDVLIKDKDQDSFTGCTGAGDSKVNVTFFPGGNPVKCHRSRLLCCGCYGCHLIDTSVIEIQRHELDPLPRERLLKAAQEASQQEGSTPESQAITYVHLVYCPFRSRLMFSQLP
ncbi:hypothetical protein C8J56DRAFT_1051720 [Mycena floridula]|nr:hypothetical protein C8J56DRAFT_1051720 [Mycena floridula]